MTLLVYGMVMALVIPVLVVLRNPDLWHRLAAFASMRASHRSWVSGFWT